MFRYFNYPLNFSRKIKVLIPTQKRTLRLHEYQAAQLVHRYMIPIPTGNVAFNSKEAYNIARTFGFDYNRKFVVKAQVQSAKRSLGVVKENGLESGIHFADTREEVRELAEKMCGNHLVTPNSQNEGLHSV